MLSLGSLFSGSGGFELAGILAGIEPLWASEIEPFPIRVTSRRLPDVKHYGDISTLDGGELPPVDIITFGSPCQDMSVAGKREGLGASRSGLFYEAVRIVKEMREKTNGEKPRYIVWENVPGAFSSNKGEDFRCVLEEICSIKEAGIHIPEYKKWTQAGEIVGDGFSVCWRTLDAQYWGVPQRRKRIYLVADFAGECASKILFESEGVSGYSAESFRAWQEAAGSIGKSTEASGIGIDGYSSGMMILNDQGGERMDVTEDITTTLRAEAHHPPLVLENHPADSRVKMEEGGVVQTLSSSMGTGGGNTPLVMETPKTMQIRCGKEGGGKGALIQDDKSATLGTSNNQTLFVPVVFGICSKGSNAMKSDNPESGIYEADTSRTLDANGGNPSCNQGGMAVVAVEGNGARPSHHGDGYSEDDVSFTLNTIEKHGVAYGLDRASFNQGKNAKYDFSIEEEVEPPIVARGPGAVAEPTFTTSKNSHHTVAEEEVANTLVATDYKDPPLVNDRPSYGFYPQMKTEGMAFTEEASGTIVNGTNPGYQNGVVEAEYIVRRLTPTECARLQGFPDWWCAGLETKEPDEEEIRYWKEIFETHSRALGKNVKPKTDNQIIKWLRNPHSDSAEYKMWGNGIALPNAVFVLAGIAYFYEVESHST